LVSVNLTKYKNRDRRTFQTKPNSNLMEYSDESGKIILPNSSEKNMILSLVLAFFFGPIGLFYASVTGGIVMILVTIIVAIFTLGFGLFIIIPICVVWAAIATTRYNQRRKESIGYYN